MGEIFAYDFSHFYVLRQKRRIYLNAFSKTQPPAQGGRKSLFFFSLGAETSPRWEKTHVNCTTNSENSRQPHHKLIKTHVNCTTNPQTNNKTPLVYKPTGFSYFSNRFSRITRLPSRDLKLLSRIQRLPSRIQRLATIFAFLAAFASFFDCFL